MIKLPLGTLVRVLVNIDLLDGCSVCVGDLGLITHNKPSLGEIHYNQYDYKILVNGCEILVFAKEIETVTYLQ